MMRRKGFTLIEVLVAMGVLAIGGLATLQLIGVLINSNQSVGAGTDAIALANRLVSEISDARFINPADVDPGLNILDGRPIVAPVTGSRIRSVGLFRPGTLDPVTATEGPIYRVEYRSVPCLICRNPVTGAEGGIEVLITVANFDRDTGPLLQPVQMMLRREYNPTLADGAAIRGIPPVGP